MKEMIRILKKVYTWAINFKKSVVLCLTQGTRQLGIFVMLVNSISLISFSGGKHLKIPKKPITHTPAKPATSGRTYEITDEDLKRVFGPNSDEAVGRVNDYQRSQRGVKPPESD